MQTRGEMMRMTMRKRKVNRDENGLASLVSTPMIS